MQEEMTLKSKIIYSYFPVMTKEPLDSFLAPQEASCSPLIAYRTAIYAACKI